jgi:3-dehydroquinate dehydratase
MNKLESHLSSMINTLDEMTKILNKSKENKENVSMTMLYKNIEDGILDKIHDANQNQLNHIMNSYRFRFYTEFNTDKELLKNEIQMRLRDNKLQKLGI